MTKRVSKASAEKKRARYERDVEILRREGAFEPEEATCGRCGGALTLYPYPVATDQTHDGAPVEIKTLNICKVCKVDRVKRWGDLMTASADEGRELRDAFDPGGTARRAASAGIVRYDNEDHAWELTPEGLALLRRMDARAIEAAERELVEAEARYSAEIERRRARIEAWKRECGYCAPTTGGGSP